MEHDQLVTKSENLSLPRGTDPKTGGEESQKAKPKQSFIVDATTIPRMIATSAFSNQTEFSVRTTEAKRPK